MNIRIRLREHVLRLVSKERTESKLVGLLKLPEVRCNMQHK
jgi:hypothetical protein